MIKILIIADDFTGALDTGVKFSSAGARTKVIMDAEAEFAMEEEVLVLCAPTRHLPAREAYRVIRRITERAVAAGIRCILKKTDSALRGNIGAELSAVLEGSGERALYFIPALPEMNRVTLEGVHYIDGLPVAQSVFGQDPFEPVTESRVAELLRLQTALPVRTVSLEEAESFRPGEERCIYVFDCMSREDMEREVWILSCQSQLRILAGCAGLGESLPPYLGLEADAGGETADPMERMTVLCGSVNPITCAQMDYGERHGGYRRLHVPAECLLEDGTAEYAGWMDRLWEAYLESDFLMIDSLQPQGEGLLEGTEKLTLEEIRQRISGRLGGILKELMDRGGDSPFMIVGGDTLLAFLESIQCSALRPVCEPRPGVVLFRVDYRGHQYEILAKSGGFGEQDLFVTLQKSAREHRSAVC